MTAEEYLSRSRLFRRLKSGPHGQLVELYAACLVTDGLACQGTWRSLSLLGDLVSWVTSSDSKLTDLDEGMVDRYLQHRSGKQSIQPGDRAALKRLLLVLREAGTIAPATLPLRTPHEQIFEGSATICGRNEVWRRSQSSAICLSFACSCVRCALPAPATSAGSVRTTSRATSSAMTKDQKIIRAKAGLLELAKQLGNVSQACKIMGFRGDSFYRR